MIETTPVSPLPGRKTSILGAPTECQASSLKEPASVVAKPPNGTGKLAVRCPVLQMGRNSAERPRNFLSPTDETVVEPGAARC